VKVTGGARIGWVNATWPLATLEVRSGRLLVSGFVIGSYAFEPSEIRALEPLRGSWLTGRGIQIFHARADLPDEFVFWTFSDPDALISRIRASGFVAAGTVSVDRRPRGIPLRWSAVLGFVAGWNLLFWTDWLQNTHPSRPGLFTLIALAIVLALSIALPRSDRLQALTLKEGRSVLEVQPFTNLMGFVSGALLLIILATLLIGPAA
jgi:hypothetical protein